MSVCFGDKMGNTKEELLDNGSTTFVALGWREKKSPDEWAELILGYKPR